MAAGSGVFLPLLLLVIVLFITLALALRFRLSFRIAARNVRRGGRRTILVLLGLLVGTTIISASLVVGDTVNAVAVQGTYVAYHGVDQGIYNESVTTSSYAFLPTNESTTLTHAILGVSGVASVSPMIIAGASVFDHTTGLPQPGLGLIGADPNSSGALGTFHTDGGATVVGPDPGMVLLDDVAAGDLNASVGDHITLVGVAPLNLTVQAIVSDSSRGGFYGGSNAYVTLAAAQQAENVSGEVNFLAVTDVGTSATGAANSPNVSVRINSTIAGLDSPLPVVVDNQLHDNLLVAAQSGSSLTDLFLVLGLFSIVAGAMLIVGIFVMIAEERKGEMGMLRAIGLPRGQLVYTYYFEGVLYALGSALAGTLLGLLVGFGLIEAFVSIEGGGSAAALAILQAFTVKPSSLLIAYVAGFLLTLVTVTIASYSVSRLNIVRAIRSIPEPPPARHWYTYLAYVGALVLVLGALIYDRTYAGSGDVSVPTLAGALMILGVALIASRFLRNRPVFTVAGAALLLWAGYIPIRRDLIGAHHSGTITVFFVDGILMVTGAVMLYTFNSDLVVNGVAALVRRSPRTVPVARIALSYPSRRPGRTAINLAIFALVLFTIVGIASIGQSVTVGVNNSVQAESGGYPLIAYSQTPVPNLPGQVANNSTLRGEILTTVPLAAGFLSEVVPGFAGTYVDSAFASPAGLPSNETLAGTADFNFSATANGSTPAEVWSALASDPDDVVVSNQYAPASTISLSGGGSHPSAPVGTRFTLGNPDSGTTRNVTVIGVLGESFVPGVFLNPATESALGIHGTSAFFFRTTAGTSDTLVLQHLKAAFYAYGLIVIDFQQAVAASLQTTLAILDLLEVFVALGLGVGIAAMGILAMRAVVERRAEIGMIRATGFTQGMVLRAFLLEYSFVTILGILIGTGLGILLDWDASQGAVALLQFAVPWENILIVVLVSYGLTVLAILGPSLSAARLPPAEAIRYSE
ncbi:MAG: FtsX-like permease family protein [Thermoplasmata archaeon]|nr:FtsX-like permease family protein [Thermoplasmata archaeon]